MRLISIVTVLVGSFMCISAQNTTAVKVSELESGVSNEQFISSVKTFFKRLKNEPKTTSGFITLDEDALERSKIVKNLIRANASLNHYVYITEPGTAYRTHWTKTEFWLIPKGADLPYEPFTSDHMCPSVNVSGPFYTTARSATITYAANISGSSQDDPISYHWQIVNAKIISGQRTPSITVKARANSSPIVAEVTLGGIPAESKCPSTASATTQRQ
jgi:hypothetical protein